MIAEGFFDTNVLLYAGSNAPADREKKAVAVHLLQTVPFAISAQVVNEYISNALGKKPLGLGEKNVDALLEFTGSVLPITLQLLAEATKIRRRYGISHWDAAIVAAALELGCKTLYTEDLNDGQEYDGVRVINPFVSLQTGDGNA